METRELQRDDVERWVVAKGRALRNGKPLRMLGVFVDFSERHRIEQDLRDLSGRLIDAHEQERSRLARELHDDACQQVAVLGLELEMLRRRLADVEGDVGDEVTRLSRRANALGLELHRVAHALHPARLEQIGLEDSDTHFDLGIAYKEMGLLDDAIHEFELAMSNSYKECIAHTMIGLCYIEKGQIADAISHFKKGLYAENKNEREELGLYFELGSAYELLHDPKEALYYFQKVAKRQPDFRSVLDKIKGLTQPQQQPAAANGPAATAEDVDAAFDDLISEGD